jgi:ComF family protein
MPETNFELFSDNPVEKKFWGRIVVERAAALYYFTRESLMQHLMHQFKYRGNRSLGLQLGHMMGERLKNSKRYPIDALAPLPLYKSRERKRGFNQSTILCEGIAEVLKVPVLAKAVSRSHHTETQTTKGRLERWQNMEGKFILNEPELIRNKHLLLVDDVITTGATIEACGAELLQGTNVRLSIATLCYASK